MTSTSARPCARVSHLTFTLAIGRMQRGPFTADDVCSVTGLSRRTVLELLKTMLQHQVIAALRRLPAGKPGPAIAEYELVRL